jgi:transcriptional antiterminator NusG
MKNWYVLRVQSGRENSVREGLERRIKMNALEGVVTRVLVPSERVTEIRGGEKRVRERKTYPGYIFVEVEVAPEAEKETADASAPAEAHATAGRAARRYQAEAEKRTGGIPEQAWFLIRETPGIGDFLGAGLVPTPMSQRDVDKMLGEVVRKEEAPKLKIGFVEGESVRIKEGPFENFDGTVDQVSAAKGLVRVIVTIFGRPTPVELEYWQVEKV